MLYQHVPSTNVQQLLSRSAFAQEVFILDARKDARDTFIVSCPLPCHEVRELSGVPVIVVLSQSYIIETEAVLDSSVMRGRIALTAALLLEPFVTNASPKATRLRRAKKTTLSLSHDLHIYKG